MNRLSKLSKLPQIFSNHLLVFITIAFISGMSFGHSLRLSDEATSVILFSVFVLLGLLTVLLLTKLNKTVIIFLPLLFFCLGVLQVLSALEKPKARDHIYNQVPSPADAVVVGTMVEMPQFDGRTSKTTIKVEAIRFKSQSYLHPSHGNILLRILGIWPPHHRPGDKLAVRVKLKRPNSYFSPGSFDYARYLAQKNIWVTGFLKSPLLVEQVEFSPGLLHRLRYLPEKVRMAFGAFLNQKLPDHQSSLYRAVLLGDRSAIAPSVLETFKASGTLHILAISGIHMAVTGTLLYLLIYWVLSRSEMLLLSISVHKSASLICLPFLIFYALLAGMNSPVTRAIAMSFIVIWAVVTRKTKSPSTLLGAAALMILVLDPLQLFTISFQLSFCAVAGILFVLPALNRYILPGNPSPKKLRILHTPLRWLTAMILVSLVAILVTAPLSILSFHRIAPVGIIANIAVEPLLCLWTLPLGIVSIPASYFSPEIAEWLLKLGTFGIDGAVLLVKFFSSLPYATIWLASPPTILIFIYYFGLVAIFLPINHSIKSLFISCLLFLASALCMFIPSLPITTKLRGDTQLSQVSFLDVGQGSATLFQLKSGEKILVDGGGSSFSKVTVGERVIGPYLWQYGIKRLDMLIITHPDSDHYNGLQFVIEHFRPKTIWTRSFEEVAEDFNSLLKSAQAGGAKLDVPTAGDKLNFGSDSIECLYNFSQSQKTVAFNTKRDQENAGIIFKACLSKECILLPGDIDTEAEKHLTNLSLNLRSTTLLAAHHGSKNSNSVEFLDAIAPDYLIVSAGRNNTNHFPHKSLLPKCSDRDIELVNTAVSGTIILSENKGTSQIYIQRRHNNNPLYPPETTMLE